MEKSEYKEVSIPQLKHIACSGAYGVALVGDDYQKNMSAIQIKDLCKTYDTIRFYRTKKAKTRDNSYWILYKNTRTFQ